MFVLRVTTRLFHEAPVRCPSIGRELRVVFGEWNVGRIQYFVSFLDGEWIITRDQERLGRFAAQQMAVEAAMEAARRLGGRADVFVQGRDKQFKLEWSSGRDHQRPPS